MSVIFRRSPQEGIYPSASNVRPMKPRPDAIEALLVSSRAIHRYGLQKLLTDASEIKVETCNLAEALAKLRTRSFDVVVIDVNMQVRDGLEFLESARQKYPRLRLLVLSTSHHQRDARIVLRAGANGYISKDIDFRELIEAVRRVAAGERYIAVTSDDSSLEIFQAKSAAPHRDLSPREREIMLLIVRGMALTEIGEKLFLSVKTISTYRTRILSKLGVKSNAELVRYALRYGILS